MHINLQAHWAYTGCVTDNVPGRVLTGAAYNDDNMTIESCVSFCDSKNFIYAGTEYARECYCGNKVGAGSNSADESQCNMACNGNRTEACGGPDRLSLFNSGTPAPAGPTTNPGPGNWIYLDCYTDNVNARTLKNGVSTPGGANQMSVVLCTSSCQNQGYSLSGVEYGGECYCGNSLANGGSPASDGSAGCSMPCNGNSSEYCGGPNRLNVYNLTDPTTPVPTSTSSPTSSTTQSTNIGTQTAGNQPSGPITNPGPGDWTYVDCYTDNVNARTLVNGVQTPGGAKQLTVTLCTSSCENQGYTLSGIEYSGECYCGNIFANGGHPAPDGSTGCNMVCNGNSSEFCGGPNRLNVYNLTKSASTTTKTWSTTSNGSQSMPTSTQPAGNGTANSLPDGWTYRGCYVDNVNGRVFDNQQPDDSSLTIESCVRTCVSLGYGIAAAEYGVQCFCDNSIRNDGVLAQSDSECAMHCGGNSSEICGDGNRLSLYANMTVKDYVPPAPQQDQLPGSWTYQGCLEDNLLQKTFPYKLEYPLTNVAKVCLDQCAAYGYGAGGMEYGDECYCGDSADIVANNRTLQPESDCNMQCPGNSSYICGGGNRISYYTWTGDPLTHWDIASGNDAGKYQFLIGGVVIPLITSSAINGKVTFVEKFQTGPPNSTGAYELDLAQLNNFTGAWRPMHVKTDVFCSAGLTLPDKAARQINVGGWAETSTYGIRLYWPDGKPGVWGKNDWQENVDELSLQAGRWYPTAMVMSNGSILVVGGEDGSNGKPVPSLEVLPNTGGGTVYCDWLEQTDPYNLYPFLAVLPSGGILVLYYNQARILDAKTFDTISTLPDIPGAVDNPKGGRTYPLEGTSVIMPQHAPYTDPLTVMVCGGSTIGNELALDNCASIQPDSSNPIWTIERMPSRRVEVCMTALPDGTYLILNGAKQGTAGFGTSSNPNMNAVLYNPTLAVNHRMTVMDNTTIARLYHSEAILLDDGRVLVSGSDPQDNVHPQEYRVEVFVPPYRLSQADIPAFEINNTDWKYNESVSFALGAAPKGDVRVSLIGADSSTHGNSMGQRTYFPAVTCDGVSCTVVSPPNASICPPAWFRMFVLDGPTPSNATWVRIGGDPGMLGNWPDYADFDTPGV